MKAANTALKRNGTATTFRLQMALSEQARLERAERIRTLREESPYTQGAIADAIGVTPRAYQRWEEGGGVTWDNLEALAKLHGVSVHWLHKGEGPRVGDPFSQLTVPPSTEGLAEEVRQLRSEVAEALAELSQVRTELQQVLSHMQHGGRGQGEAGS